MIPRPATFFDLGGTLLALDDNDEIAHDERSRVTVLPGVRERLTSLAGTPIFVVTNQAGVADGSITRQELNGYLTQLSDEVGGAITAWAACTHPRTAGCPCRKPRPGLVRRLAESHAVDLGRSTLVGDSPTDQQLATAAGIGTFVWSIDYFPGEYPQA